MPEIFHYTSRIERLSILDTPDKKFFIKRDDELPHGGSKARKYASLLPAVLKSGLKTVVLKGGKHSNHKVHFSRLLAEYDIYPAECGFVVEEGGSQRESIRGALTLAADIPNEFDHILIDSGSGMMAAALTHGTKCMVHVLQLAPLNFAAKYEEWFECSFPKERCQVHIPSKWKSFGSFTKPLLRYIESFPLPLDPIYSGKLLYFTQEITQGLTGNILIIHQGVSVYLKTASF